MMAEISSTSADFMSKGSVKRDKIAAKYSKSPLVPIWAATAAFLQLIAVSKHGRSFKPASDQLRAGVRATRRA
ncbi:hypothetical protein [Bradyrhizobium sp. ARR65]|uniref:hypothetical protein n=1 Tax=Bradyrhizobium sp. ARR65 TaxID=1040989 RepID=UPI0004664341|nr:hypothetical protein [Bradyrhizobium sp. ARR65]